MVSTGPLAITPRSICSSASTASKRSSERYWPAAIDGHHVSAARLLLKVLQAEVQLLGLDRSAAQVSRGVKGKPWGIGMTDEELSLWEAAGRPPPWTRPTL